VLAEQALVAQKNAELRQAQLIAEVVRPAEAEAERITTLARAQADATKLSAEAAAAVKTASEARAAVEKTVAEAAQAVARAAEAQSKSTAEGKAAADQVKAAADELKKIADGLKAAADKAAADAEARAKAGTEAQAAAAKIAADAANAAKPQNVNVGFASTAVTFRITQAPVSIAAFAPLGALKQGAKVEIPVVVTRLYGFAEAVQVSGAAPQGVGGLSIPAVTIPAGQDRAVLVVAAAADATAGQHPLAVQAAVKFGGQDLQAAQTISLSVEKP